MVNSRINDKPPYTKRRRKFMSSLLPFISLSVGSASILCMVFSVRSFYRKIFFPSLPIPAYPSAYLFARNSEDFADFPKFRLMLRSSHASN